MNRIVSDIVSCENQIHQFFLVCRERRRFPVGEIPTRPLSLRPVALGAVGGGNDFY